MKRCKYCDRERPEEAFTVCRIIGEKIYRRQRCSQCALAENNKRRRELSKWLRGYKKTLCCLDCGCADYRCLAFHHNEAAEKELNVADMVRRVHSRAHILREIAKCIVLCSNCHQIRHADE